MLDSNFLELSIRQQCKILNICRSSIYYDPVEAAKEEYKLSNMIHEIWLRRPSLGYRKIKIKLEELGYQINHKKVQRLMQLMNLQAIYPKPKLSANHRPHLVYPYLLNKIDINRVNQAWATDITYIRMPEGFIYLLAIIDLYSRYILVHEISITLEAEFCIELLKQAITLYQKPDIFNTDQGTQFTSNGWCSTLLTNNIMISMDGKGRCFDNIFVERLWRTIKYEEVYLNVYETVNEARQSLADFIRYYNYERPHQSLNYETPSAVYNNKLRRKK